MVPKVYFEGYWIEVSKVYMVPKVYFEGYWIEVSKGIWLYTKVYSIYGSKGILLGVWDRSFQSLYGS